MSFIISELSKRLCMALTTKYKDKALHFSHAPPCHTPQRCWACCSLNTLYTFLPWSLPLLCPLATIDSAKICTDLLYYFIQVSVQISSARRLYLNTNSPLITGYLSELFSTWHSIMYLFVYFYFFQWNVSFLETGLYFISLLCLGHLEHFEPWKNGITAGEVSQSCISLRGEFWDW